MADVTINKLLGEHREKFILLAEKIEQIAEDMGMTTNEDSYPKYAKSLLKLMALHFRFEKDDTGTTTQ